MAYRWVETLAAMKQGWWQVLPLGPTGAGNSPYQSFSAFAGEIKLLSPELLERDGLVSSSMWAGKHFPESVVDYAQVTPFKTALVKAAWEHFRDGKAAHLKDDFASFQAREAKWLNPFALFMAIHEAQGKALVSWPKNLLKREPKALQEAEKQLLDQVGMHKFGQFLFDRQWLALRKFAAERGVGLIGDASIFVAADSADVWSFADEFLLATDGTPTVVAGVPPDYFSEDGQHWGNPIYDWASMERTGYSWWCDRMKRQLEQVDLVRIDHFRGFCQAWHIPVAEKTAKNGKWVDGPGIALFERLRQALNGLPVIAEDLGVITDDVVALRDKLGLPGMRVLQFALDGPSNTHWPHNYVPNCVAYTGTHDNDTTNGWYAQLNDKDRNYLSLTLGHRIDDPAWELLRAVWASVATLAIAPLQDVLSLGSDARMNRPGVADGNWRWRFRLDQFRADLIARLGDMTTLYNRAPPVKSKPAM
jgi:4-alpha-glucanotransferase